MKKIIVNIFLLVTMFLAVLFVILSTTGIQTAKFNNLITEKVYKTKNINLNLNKIRFKINLKEISLFLETQNPEITYNETIIPVSNLKVFMDFFSFAGSNPKIKKIRLTLEELDIVQLNKLSSMIKPSNFKSLINNKIKEGKLISEIEIFLNDTGYLKDFIARGTVNNLKVELINNLEFNNASFNFFADKNDVLIKNIYGDLEDIKISEGDIKLNLENGLNLNSNFNSKLNFDEKILSKYKKYFNKYELSKNIKSMKADVNNNIKIDLDKTYKLKNYDYKIYGVLEKAEIKLPKPIKNNIIIDEINKIYLSDFKISTNLKTKEINFKGEGEYSLDNLNFLKMNVENSYKNDLANLILNFDYKNNLELELINFRKTKNSIANLSLHLEKNKLKTKIKRFIFKEEKNVIEIINLIFKKEKFISFDKINITTKNNDFFIHNKNKILIKGNKFDATNLSKFLSDQSAENKFQNINSKIEIDFKNIKAPMSENLQNFKLIGEIKKGQFYKISSKGDFGGNNFLDISMKQDNKNNSRYLEIYSDLPRPLLTEYSFFKGLSGGKLLFNSIINDTKSMSKLKIENFRVINAPGVIKLLSLADLGGLEDLAKGEGLSFDVLEIDMEKNNDFLKINEILALGPSMSVLMEGYLDKSGLISFRGTLVPAKTLNKMISKIPVIGNIVIPKEVGEGLFGISFKMKGPKDDIKTTINPIKTLTPRFIQKIIEKNKEPK